MKNWNEFIKKTQSRQPIGFLMEAVKILGQQKGPALDLGCGAGIDSKYLAENGFNVEAIDINDTGIKNAKKICKNLPVIIIKKDIVNYKIVPNKYKLIISWNSLPFLKKNDAQKNLINIQKGLVPDGIFVFSFFGPEDDWAKNHPEPIMSFWEIKELKQILSKMEFIKILEEKQTKPGATGEIKFWHLIQGIAKRKLTQKKS